MYEYTTLIWNKSDSVALQLFCLFIGKSKSSVGTNSAKGKSLASTNSKKANGVETSKGTVKVVSSRKEHQVRNLISSLMTYWEC